VNILTFSILCGLVTWRVASLLHTEDAFEWLREWIGIGNDAKGYPAIYPETFWGKVFDCFWCLSLVVSVPIALLIVVCAEVSFGWAPFVWLAASTVAIWTEKQILRAQSR
jgi:hypothetical protein